MRSATIRVYMDEHGESGEQWEGNLHPAGGDGTIYGDGGYARYRVYGNGEVVLVASNTRPERVAKAVAAGFTVVPQ